MEADDKRRSLLNRLQKTLSDAIMLIVEEQEHHALCYRAISMMQPYAQILPQFYGNHVKDFTEEQKASLARWLEYMMITLQSANNEQARDYQRVKRRTVIILADVIEAVVKIVTATCLQDFAETSNQLRELTGYKKPICVGSDAKNAVRKWEQRLYPILPSRVDRFEYMLVYFFPDFVRPPNFKLLDTLIERRNQLTHDVIPLSENIQNDPEIPTFTAQQIDDFFVASGDFVLAMLNAVSTKITGEIASLDPRYESSIQI